MSLPIWEISDQSFVMNSKYPNFNCNNIIVLAAFNLFIKLFNKDNYKYNYDLVLGNKFMNKYNFNIIEQCSLNISEIIKDMVSSNVKSTINKYILL